MNMEARERGPLSPVPDELVLAAIERAACHGSEPVWIAVVGEHLGFARASHDTRRLRTRLEELRVKERCVERQQRSGREYWRLAETGETWLPSLRNEAKLSELPESPQHREWRQPREAARRRIEDFLIYLQIGPGGYSESVNAPGTKPLAFVGPAAGPGPAPPGAPDPAVHATITSAAGAPALHLQGGGSVANLRLKGADGASVGPRSSSEPG